MLKKYYKALGKEFKQSTKELYKKATIIPKKEQTVNEILEELFPVDIISCDTDNYGNVIWKGSVTSYATKTVDLSIMLTGEDSKGNIVTFNEKIVWDLYPGQTQYISEFLDEVPNFVKCDYEMNALK